MSEDLKQRLIDLKIMTSMKQVFNSAELRLIFEAVSEITGKVQQPTSCGACINNALSVIKRAIRENNL